MEDNLNKDLVENEMDEIEEEERKNSGRFLAGFIVMMLIIPALVIMVIYNMNPKFRSNIDNTVFSIKERFKDKNGLTPEERRERVNYLAEHYTSIDEESAIDKLYIIKQDDESLYQDIIVAMKNISAPKTKSIIEQIRSKELNKDLLVQNYEEVLGLEGDADASMAKSLESMDLLLAKKELISIMHEPNFENIVTKVNPDRLAEILYYLPGIESSKVLDALDVAGARKIRNKMDSLQYENENLISTAEILDKRPTAEAIEYLDNRPEIGPKQLAVIFEYMSLPKAAQIAAGLEDKKRLDESFYEMNMLERLLEKEEGRASEISELVDYVTEYNKKIDDLVGFYKKVDGEKIAKIFEKMINNDKDVTVLSLTDADGTGQNLFKTTDRKVAIDIAKKMKSKQVSEIVSNMDVGVAALFTELLAHPDRTITHEQEGTSVAEVPKGEGENEEFLTLHTPKKSSNISLNVDFNDDNVIGLSNEYMKRAKDLANAFDQMKPEELSKIVREMLKGTEKNRQTLAYVISNVKSQTMSALLSELSTADRTTLTNIMATGNVKESFKTDTQEAADAVAVQLAKVYDQMESSRLATLIKRTVDDAYDYEDTKNLDSLIRVLSKVNENNLAKALDLLNPDMSGEITDLIYKYKHSREVSE